MFLSSKCHIPRSNLNLKRTPKGFKSVETQELFFLGGACMSNFSIANMGESALRGDYTLLLSNFVLVITFQPMQES